MESRTICPARPAQSQANDQSASDQNNGALSITAWLQQRQYLILIGTQEIRWVRTRWPCCDLVADNISYRLDLFPIGLVYLHDWVPFASPIIMLGTKPNLNGESVAATSTCPFGAINQA